MKKIILIASGMFFMTGLIGQNVNFSKLRKANKKYEAFSYEKAIDLFIASNDSAVQTQRKLADALIKTGKYDQAEEVLSNIVSSDKTTSEDIYTYASVLEINKKYSEAIAWMEKFARMAPQDLRAKNFTKKQAVYEEIRKDKGQFRIKNLDINTKEEDFAAVFYDSDKAVFVSSREGVKPIRRKWNWNGLPFLDVFIANINGDYELSDPELFDRGRGINKKFHEGPVAFNTSRDAMWITRNNYSGKSSDGTINLQLWYSEKDERGKWSTPEPIALNSDEYSVGHAWISADNKWMYFASDMPGGYGGVDIYRVEIKEDGTYGEPINLGNTINTEGNEMFPMLHSNGYLFFASDGLTGLGGLDVFVAQVTPDGKIGEVKNLGAPVNSSFDDFAFILDVSAKGGYFSSNRDTGKGNDDIYSFILLKPFMFHKTIKGKTFDKDENIVPEATVVLYDLNGNTLDIARSDSLGNFSFVVEPDEEYKLIGRKTGYFEGTNTADTKDENEDEVIVNLILEKDPGVSLYAIITDSKTNQPLDSVEITLINNLTDSSEVFRTGETGDFRKALEGVKLGDRGSFNLVLKRKGYLTKTVTYNFVFDHQGQYDVHAALDLTMDPVVKDLSELVEISPINFDLNKYNIRPDAAKELDKIVEIMNKYPKMIVELGSHTDCRGSKAYNMRLSDKRAKASAAYIKKRIVNPDRIYGKGYGESKLLNDCACEGNVKSNCSEEEHAVNRRTEFRVIDTGNEDVRVINRSPDSF